MSENSRDQAGKEKSASASGKMRWYVVHVYSGMEKSVRRSLMERIERMGMSDKFGQILVPTEEVVEVKGGQRSVTERRFFPGYVLIEMEMTDDTWHLVRNVRGVTGFVGFVDSNNKAIPLTEEEVLAMGMEKHEIIVKYAVGDHVRIVDGPFSTFTGVVEEIEPEKNRVSVMVSMFGRETPVEMELDQVETLE